MLHQGKNLNCCDWHSEKILNLREHVMCINYNFTLNCALNLILNSSSHFSTNFFAALWKNNPFRIITDLIVILDISLDLEVFISRFYKNLSIFLFCWKLSKLIFAHTNRNLSCHLMRNLKSKIYDSFDLKIEQKAKYMKTPIKTFPTRKESIKN